MVKQCSNCGSDLKDNAQFCASCGQKVVDNVGAIQSVDDDFDANKPLVKLLMIYDESEYRYRYSKSKLIGVVLFAWTFLSSFIGIVSNGIWVVLTAIIIGIFYYLICVGIGYVYRKFIKSLFGG